MPEYFGMVYKLFNRSSSAIECTIFFFYSVTLLLVKEHDFDVVYLIQDIV